VPCFSRLREGSFKTVPLVSPMKCGVRMRPDQKASEGNLYQTVTSFLLGKIQNNNNSRELQTSHTGPVDVFNPSACWQMTHCVCRESIPFFQHISQLIKFTFLLWKIHSDKCKL
jgi:hypothetical protein